MHDALQKLFDEHAAPTHASGDDLRAQLKPILLAASAINKQMALYREHHLNAKLDAHDPGLDGKIELLRQRYAAAEKLAGAFLDHGEKLADAIAHIERDMKQAELDIAHYEAMETKGTPA